MLPLLNRLKSDESLMLAYQNGDTGAFELLYRRHKDGLYAFLYRSCARAAVVEELAQDSWVGVVKAAGRYRPEARFKTWLYQIAHNRLVDHWRRPDSFHSSLETTLEPVATPAAYEFGELEQRLLAAVGQLPPEQQDALLLQGQGFSVSEVAEITGSGEETTKSRLRYARMQLRELMGGEQ
ncbi:MAG: sigma-70 family RNA polymerase sigma factor [Halieaceae bacterium]|jgi:RNA polymerase sigma-70 factor, ECF subfamily|nr:sigma-70 family RNA polymerase sigma factor [Halieaceae bacterium]